MNTKLFLTKERMELHQYDIRRSVLISFMMLITIVDIRLDMWQMDIRLTYL